MTTPDHDQNTDIVRRRFLKNSLLSALGFGAISIGLGGCQDVNIESLLQKHFKELSKSELEQTINRLESEYHRQFGRSVKVNAEPARQGVNFAYGLDLSRCIGCRRCAYACVEENNQSRIPQIHYITVLELEAEKGIELFESHAYYNPPQVPQDDKIYIPVACQHCRQPQCTKVCPVKATWTEPDGCVVVDYNWCIGCRYCMAACPYGARRFNWKQPGIEADELITDTHYLGNRPRPAGVVEKCTFCINRVRHGRYPSCVEICPVGARKFGNLLDPESEIRQIIETKRVFILKPELNTQPKFYYFYSV